MADEVRTSQDARDQLAGVVVTRYRRAKEYREQYIVHQGQSAQTLIERAEHQYRREYTAADSKAMQDSFGFCPSRYMGLVQQKVNATVAWNNDLVVNNLNSMFTVTPSPEPTLDKASLDRIREGVQMELVDRMLNAGLVDSSLLLTADGDIPPIVDDVLREQVAQLRKVESARIVAMAADNARRAQTRMRDIMVEGKFRQAYMPYTFDRMLYGLGVLRFPEWRRLPRLVHKRGGAEQQWEVVPVFRHVRIKDFFPIADSDDYQTNTGNTEVTHITKAELINRAQQKDTPYFKDQIKEIIEEYAYRTRNWLGFTDSTDERTDWWNLDDTIPMLIHEGFFSGGELKEYGISGVDEMDYVNARIEVVGGRTIRAELIRMPTGNDRSYFAAPFNKIGDNLYDYLGMAGMLWDSEQRVNRLMHLFENNVDWAARPPLLTNSAIFEDTGGKLRPGETYEISDAFVASRSMPDPVRSMHTVSAQYHLIMTQVGAILRQADEDTGVPAFAYSAQDFGRSSLGEYSQRMTNALRTIKQAALNEDIYLIEPTFRGLFNYEMEHDPELVEGQDVNVQIRGMTGLLQEDQKRLREEQVLPLVMQGAQAGVVPEEAVQYAIRSLLQQAGFPVEALGISNPEVEQAFAAAASSPLAGVNPGSQQVPPLDGRSGVPAQNVATPEGASQMIPGAPV